MQKGKQTKIRQFKDENSGLVVKPKQQAKMLNSCNVEFPVLVMTLNHLNSFYASVFTRNNDNIPTKDPDVGTAKLNDICINDGTVKRMIDLLNENSSPGLDGITNLVLKSRKNKVAKPLAIMFRKSMDERKIPNDCPEAVPYNTGLQKQRI